MSRGGILGPAQLPDDDRERRIDTAVREYFAALEAGRPLDSVAWLKAHPEVAPELAEFLEELHGSPPLVSSFRFEADELAWLDRGQFPSTIGDDVLTDGGSDGGGSSTERSTTQQVCTEDPEESTTEMTLGRYRVIRIIGRGGFGEVHLARDMALNRLVAVKIPNPDRISRPEEYQQFLREARTLAQLEHENIVSVYDVGTTEAGWCYIVSRYINGKDLGRRMDEGRIPLAESCLLIEAICRAAHHAHVNGLVHRDIKPSNILLDVSGQPFLTDFGVALSDDEYGRGSNWAGTPAYMSPEQARGEGHRVDGRSDVFSLGVVFYRLLAGKLPFRGASNAAVMHAIATADPKPLRQANEAVPVELERICLRALCKRASERYASALEMANDVRHYLDVQGRAAPANGVRPASADHHAGNGSSRSTLGNSAAAEPSRLTPFSPKGLKSFERNDSDFFLELLPGLKDRDGVPQSLRYWLDRIDGDEDGDQPFRVGMIYGPSGCGKSSFVKAGLIPRLSRRVETIYLEATESKTEGRLLHALRRAGRAPAGQADLVEAMTALRRDQPLGPGRKHLIVIDQFEQWLLGYSGDEASELYSALRQCDGETLQALLLVRDDFWVAATRFMRQLDVDLLSDRNMAAIDLFDRRHARKVLAALGQGYEALPDRPSAMSREQSRFLDEAVEELAVGEKIIPIQLAVFAEMIKSKPWTLSTLKRVGGAHGLGATYLEETFGPEQADPRLSRHREGAQAVLESLLPSSPADVKGELRSASELRNLSGYANRPPDFDELIRILAVELRLITTADPDNAALGDSALDWPKEPHYILTHDYLVRSIREWMDRRSRDSWRGRIGRLLAERSSLWASRPERRHLPSLLEYVVLTTATRRRDRTPPQAMYLHAALQYHSIRSTAITAAVLAVVALGWDQFGRIQARSIQGQLIRASAAEVPAIIKDMAAWRHWAVPLIRHSADVYRRMGDTPPIGIDVAILDSDARQAEVLVKRLLSASPVEVNVIREALMRRRKDLGDEAWSGMIGGLWSDLSDASLARESNIRAACALAAFAPEDQQWKQVAPEVVECLVSRDPVLAGGWIELLAPVGRSLKPELLRGFLDRDWADERREIAASALSQYCDDDVPKLVELASLASPTSQSPFIVALRKHPDSAALLQAEFEKLGRERVHQEGSRHDTVPRQRAALATVQLGVGRSDLVLEALRMTADPTMRSHLIVRISRARISPVSILDLLRRPDLDDAVVQGLVLTLGQYDPKDMAVEDRKALVRRIVELHRDHPDAGVHSAASWLLARLKTKDELVAEPGPAGDATGREWFVSRRGLTFALVRGPIDFTFDPALVSGDRTPPHVHTGRSFSVTTTEVSRRQYREITGEPGPEEWNGEDDLPANYLDFYAAMRFCRILSEREGVAEDQMCYPTVDRIGPDMHLPPDHLSRSGYRLPTEAEFYAATFGDARTTYPFGSDPDLISHFVRHFSNSGGKVGAVAERMPNHLGLFDLLGNVYEWTEPFSKTQEVAADECVDRIGDDLAWVLKGGAYHSDWSMLGTIDYRNYNSPRLVTDPVGFRVVRTCP